MGEFGPGVLCGAFFVALISIGKCSDYGERTRREGRCLELCRPERLVEVVNDWRECLCTNKRVRLP